MIQVVQSKCFSVMMLTWARYDGGEYSMTVIETSIRVIKSTIHFYRCAHTVVSLHVYRMDSAFINFTIDLQKKQPPDWQIHEGFVCKSFWLIGMYFHGMQTHSILPQAEFHCCFHRWSPKKAVDIYYIPRGKLNRTQNFSQMQLILHKIKDICQVLSTFHAKLESSVLPLKYKCTAQGTHQYRWLKLYRNLELPNKLRQDWHLTILSEIQRYNFIWCRESSKGYLCHKILNSVMCKIIMTITYMFLRPASTKLTIYCLKR